MSPVRTEPVETIVPSQAEARIARISSRQMARLLKGRGAALQVRIRRGKDAEEEVAIPVSALRILADTLAEMAQGHAVTLLPVNAELSTQQAADVLNVSRQFVSRLVESGALPSRKLGTRRRVALRDLLAFKQRDDDARQQVANQLAADAQDLKMGY